MEEEDRQEPRLCSKCTILYIGESDYLKSFPPGYKFKPTDEELILLYLKAKVRKECLPCCKIDEVNLYEFSPEDLTKHYVPCEENNWYFFTRRDRKYKNGNRPNRAAGDGYWKATGKDKTIEDNGIVVGYKKSLVFHTGKAPNGTKTNWIMYEYRLDVSPLPKGTGENGMMLDLYVLCRIHWKKEKQGEGTNNDQPNEEEKTQDMIVQHPTTHQTVPPSVHLNNIVPINSRNNQNLEHGINVGTATSYYQNPNTTFGSSMTFLKEEVQQFNNNTQPMGMDSGYNYLGHKLTNYFNNPIQYHPPVGPIRNSSQCGPLPLSGFDRLNPNGMCASDSQPPPNLNGMLPSARQAPPSFRPMGIDRTSDYNHLIGKPTRNINRPIHPPECPKKNLSQYGPRAPPSFDPPNINGMLPSGPRPGFDLPNINEILDSRPPAPSGFDMPNPYMMFACGHPDPRLVSLANKVREHLTRIPSTRLSREGPSVRYSSGSNAKRARREGEMENHQGSNQDQTDVHDQSSGSEMDHQHSNSEDSSS